MRQPEYGLHEPDGRPHLPDRSHSKSRWHHGPCGTGPDSMSTGPGPIVQRTMRKRGWRAAFWIVMAAIVIGGGAWLYRLVTFPIRELTTLPGHKKAVWSLAFSSSGKLLASAGEDEVVRLWDVTMGQERCTFN